MLTNDDTIAAISTAVGPAARIIVRASGQGVRRIHDVLKGDEIEFAGGSARRARIGFAGITVPAWVYCFAAPRSATGEDVIEFHIPGNPLLARMLLEELMRLGARQAQPGEFTARAYFNGRIDLSEAEGVAAAIAAQSERELAAARQLLAGELARRLRPTMDLIAETLALVEVGIDFSEEDVTFLSGDELRDRILRADEALAGLLRDSTRFERLAHEPHIVLVGRPNAGKSTLLNALAGSQRAIVSAQPGTTRDAIWAQVRLPRGMVRIIDVAGIDQHDPIDQIAKPIDQIASQMQARTRQTMEQADLLVLVRDCTDRRPPPPLTRQPDLRVATKLDLNPDARLLADELGISALCQWNLEELRRRLDTLAFGQSGTDAALALNARHVQAVQQAREALARALPRVADQTAELLALELREALDALGTILGTVGPDELLARIFSRFCIGK